MNAYRTQYRTKGGYTLIEMLVVVAIIGIVFPVLMNTIVSLYRTHGDSLGRAAALIEATGGVEEVVRDARAAVYSEAGALPLVTTTATTLILYADTDFDGRVERVRYFLDGTNVRKGIVEPSGTGTYTASETIEDLAHGIVNTDRGVPLFRYYSATSTEIAPGTQQLSIRRIETEFVAISSLGRTMRDVRIRSSAAIRNLKDTY